MTVSEFIISFTNMTEVFLPPSTLWLNRFVLQEEGTSGERRKQGQYTDVDGKGLSPADVSFGLFQ